MTERTRPPSRICPSCDGYASVAVTLGGRDRNNNLRIITAHCLDCHGIGMATVRRSLTREGARV